MPQDHTTQKSTNDLVLQFIHVRQALGYLGFFLPLSLCIYGLLPGRVFQPSISEFYYTHMGDVLVGTLCAIGIFLISYKGYARKPGEVISDKWLSRATGLFAIGVAMFPVRVATPDMCAQPEIHLGLECHRNILHFGSASLFFVCMMVFCIVVFTRGDRSPEGRIQWTGECLIYVTCGAVIGLSLLAMAPFVVWTSVREALTPYKYLYIWESVGVFAFAVAWLVKGRRLRMLRAAADSIAPASRQKP